MDNEDKETELAITSDTIRDRIRLSIQKEFVNAIPDDAWDKLIAAEIALFMEDKHRGGRTETSPLRKMIFEELKKLFAKKIDDYLASPAFFSSECDEQGIELASSAVEDILTRIGPALWKAAIGSVVQDVVQKMRSSIY